MGISSGVNAGIDGLVQNWTFPPAPIQRWERRQIGEAFFRNIHRQPAAKTIKAATARPTWIVYFMYAPQASMTAAHHFTLSRLKDMGLPVLVVCATTDANRLPDKLAGYCDALLWKDLPGYDFSAYTLALRHISHHSAGADVYVLNDSVFGPFTDLRETIGKSPWELAGFTASNELTNHIQSYSFYLRNVTRQRMRQLMGVFFPFVSISGREAVIQVQELRLARIAAQSMTVGASWYSPNFLNPTLRNPFELLDNGFPFVKRALIGASPAVVDQSVLLDRLVQLRHPVPDGLRS